MAALRPCIRRQALPRELRALHGDRDGDRDLAAPSRGMLACPHPGDARECTALGTLRAPLRALAAIHALGARESRGYCRADARRRGALRIPRRALALRDGE